MSEHLLIGLAAVVVLGITAQWLAWRLHLPAILLLLVFGLVAGPLTGVLDPDEVFGDLLFPLVSVSVAIILFEGGLSLRLAELRPAGGIIRNLVTIGIIVTWILATLGAYLLTSLSLAVSVLLGAVLVVSGPTVIIPLLRQVRPKGKIGSIVKWEGIVNDPLGAILAVLVFEVIAGGSAQSGSLVVIWGVIKALVAGSLIGVIGAAIVVLLLKRYFIPDFLQNPVALMLVVMCYVSANALATESGLLAVTVMGLGLANQRFVSIRHITDFKESLRVLLISCLFIMLAARLSLADLGLWSLRNWAFVAFLILIVRPVAVWVSSLGSGLKRGERLFLAWMAPRGIVAAAVVSVFAIRMVEAGVPGSSDLVPLTFQVIIGTVAVYGLTARPVARWCGVAQPNPQGILFAGAQPWVQSMAAVLRNEGFETALVDSNWASVTAARNAGFRAYYASILSENLFYEVQFDGIGRLLAMTPNDEVNSLAALHFVDIFGRSEVYQLFPAEQGKSSGSLMPMHLRGRYLFSETATFSALVSRFRSGAVVKKTLITEEFTFDAFKKMYGESAIPLLMITESEKLVVYTADSKPSPEPGQTLISIVDPVEMEKVTSNKLQEDL